VINFDKLWDQYDHFLRDLPHPKREFKYNMLFFSNRARDIQFQVFSRQLCFSSYLQLQKKMLLIKLHYIYVTLTSISMPSERKIGHD